MKLAISVCTFTGGGFDVMFRDKETGEEVTLSGTGTVSEDDFAFLNKIAPACVWTTYERITPED